MAVALRGNREGKQADVQCVQFHATHPRVTGRAPWVKIHPAEDGTDPKEPEKGAKGRVWVGRPAGRSRGWEAPGSRPDTGPQRGLSVSLVSRVRPGPRPARAALTPPG